MSGDRSVRRPLDGWLLTLCASRSFNMLVFQTYAAALPVVWGAWHMSAVEAGSISTGFQAGYAVSLLCFSALADRVGARRVVRLGRRRCGPGLRPFRPLVSVRPRADPRLHVPFLGTARHVGVDTGFRGRRPGGHRRAVLVMMAAAATACSFLFGWLVGWPLALVFAVGAVYAFTALGDSPVLSTAVTEAVSPSDLGSALALRSLLGFGAGAIAPLAFGAVLKATNAAGSPPATWGWAFVTLGLGGLGATLCAVGLPWAPVDRRP